MVFILYVEFLYFICLVRKARGVVCMYLLVKCIEICEALGLRVAFGALHVHKYAAFTFPNRKFQLLVYACRAGWEVRYHIADYAEKTKMVAA